MARKAVSLEGYGSRVIVYMPQEVEGKMKKLAWPYHVLIQVVEVRPNCFLVLPVVLPSNEPILVSIDHVVECSDKIPDGSWLEMEDGTYPGCSGD